ncbi:hypothetical protein BN1002_03757 [Bacillus sp. B-jedd]|nr:hypothetical protein BN1002_03757 [Bacillus sp. B-jedd]
MWAIPGVFGVVFLLVGVFYRKRHHGQLASDSGFSGDSILFELVATAFLFVLDLLPFWVTKLLCLAAAAGLFYAAYQML